MELHASHIEVSPPTVANAIVAWPNLSAFRTAGAAPPRRNINDQPSVVEPDIDDTGLFQSQQEAE
jgi:hypothetical protein